MTTIAIGAVGVAAGLMFAPRLVPVCLGLIGFSAIGPVAGEFPKSRRMNNPPAHTNKPAAKIQAAIGNVVGGSLFAIVQSVAMGGAIPAVISAIFATLISLITAGLSLLI
jgi:hypothetical protein